MADSADNPVDSRSGAAKTARIRNLHIITRFDKGGSAENTFLTVSGLNPTRYETFLITGSGAQDSSLPSGSSYSVPRRRSKFNADSRSRGFSDGGDDSVDVESAAAMENMEEARTRGVKTFIVPELVRRVDPLRDLRAFVRTRQIIRRLAPHIVHTHTSKAGIVGRLAALSAQVPIVVHTPHGHVFWGYFGAAVSRFFIILERFTARSTDRLIMLTEQEKADHLSHHIAPPDKFVVIHSGVCLEHFSSISPEERRPGNVPSLPSGAFVIGTVGRLTAIKGHRYLLEAAAKLIREIPELVCVVVGEGEMHRKLEEQTAALGMGGRVIFPGWRENVGTYMSALDIFVMPSLNEGMGRVVVEAMASGRPVVASNVGGLKNLVNQGENGILVPPGDAEALAAAIRMLYRHPERRRAMGVEGRKMAPAFSAGAMIMKIDELYQELLREKHVW